MSQSDRPTANSEVAQVSMIIITNKIKRMPIESYNNERVCPRLSLSLCLCVPVSSLFLSFLYLLFTQMIHRLKTRLALANFKRQHGFEKCDLQLLEFNLLDKRRLDDEPRKRKKAASASPEPPSYYRRYYPADKAQKAPSNKNSTTMVTRCNTPMLIQSPLSAKRSTSPRFAHRSHQLKSPRPSSSASTVSSTSSTASSTLPNTQDTANLTFSSDDEDAANLLVMLHNHKSLSS